MNRALRPSAKRINVGVVGASTPRSLRLMSACVTPERRASSVCLIPRWRRASASSAPREALPVAGLVRLPRSQDLARVADLALPAPLAWVRCWRFRRSGRCSPPRSVHAPTCPRFSTSAGSRSCWPSSIFVSTACLTGSCTRPSSSASCCWDWRRWCARMVTPSRPSNRRRRPARRGVLPAGGGASRRDRLRRHQAGGAARSPPGLGELGGGGSRDAVRLLRRGNLRGRAPRDGPLDADIAAALRALPAQRRVGRSCRLLARTLNHHPNPPCPQP